MPRLEPKEETPIAVQPVEELLTVELIPGDPDKTTKDRIQNEGGCLRASDQLPPKE
ncbi:UNVERIFIED_CONTAM: hypothetical protein Slati_0772000 [Sesamum latifolium]|uniref:Uncharacterized protein n=1 Tax=Sesamum latifolium TaxID=2727402 RepID=A0AAW2XL99_9LAMI